MTGALFHASRSISSITPERKHYGWQQRITAVPLEVLRVGREMVESW